MRWKKGKNYKQTLMNIPFIRSFGKVNATSLSRVTEFYGHSRYDIADRARAPWWPQKFHVGSSERRKSNELRDLIWSWRNTFRLDAFLGIYVLHFSLELRASAIETWSKMLHCCDGAVFRMAQTCCKHNKTALVHSITGGPGQGCI